MNFIVYDLAFLGLFTLFAIVFLYQRRKNLKRQGWLFLYHTKVGLVIMDRIAKRFRGFLRPLQYVVVGCGYALLAGIVVLLIKSTYDYVTSPYLAQAIKIPPLLPLFPYFPQIFKIESLFPPFYFTYFLVAVGLVAVGHEFAHGIFARLNNVRIKSTGFAFLGPFFGAFVEQDDRDMAKKKKFPQLAILAAGVFANVIMTIIFGLVLWAFFAASFAPAGIEFNTYGASILNVSDIDNANNVPFADINSSAINPDGLVNLTSGNKNYFVSGLALKIALENEAPLIAVYDDSPALQARLAGPIVAMDGQPVNNIDSLRELLGRHKPGDSVTITTIKDKNRADQTLILGDREGKPYLGIGISAPSQRGLGGWVRGIIWSIKDPFVYYEPTWGGDFAWFVYYMIWWVVIINLLVAFVNMLPLGILDGGRFFYLSVWGLTGSESVGKKAFSIATWFFLGLLALMMVKWVFTLF